MADTKIFTEEERELIDRQFNTLMKNLYRCNREGDRELIEKAFKVAEEAHRDMLRRSGEPYIIHPLAVAQIVNSEIGLGAKSIAAALLHDVVEDTDITVEDIERDFGPKIASLIDGLTKISGTYDKENSSRQAENFKKMLLTLSDDIRVILIKIADRLHNMRTLDAMPERKKMKIAGETIYLYAPLAHRLGLFTIKTELEDLSFKYRHPRIYEEIATKLKHSEKKNQLLINSFSLPIIERLEAEGFKFDINGRPKSIYSIWKKMQTKNVPFEEVYDILAVRIIFDPVPDTPEKSQCWSIYSLITDIYHPKPDRLRDWVSRPKPNGYEALHLTVMGPHGKWVEVQIRSRRMDEVAERGLAAHWKYKGDNGTENELDRWIKRIRQMLENPLEDPVEFLDEFKMNLFSSEIMVFTPKGYLVNLPKGATALDFAYEIHTEIGNKAIGAKINYKLNPLSTKLNSGDQVEIITSDKANPEKEWYNYVSTAKARASIKAALKSERKDFVQKGKELLEARLEEFKIQNDSEIIRKLVVYFEAMNREDLYSKVGHGLISTDELTKGLKKNTANRLMKYWDLKLTGNSKIENHGVESPVLNTIDRKVPFLLRENIDSLEQSYQIAKCCNPIPGDEVLGYMPPKGPIIIHKPKCPVAVRLSTSEGNNIITVKWTIHKLLSFPARISINGIDRIGLIKDVSNVISTELSVNIRNINVSVSDGIFEGTIDVFVHHITDLNNLIMKIASINGIQKVHRIEEMNE